MGSWLTRAGLRRYAVAWGYLAVFVVFDLTLALFSPDEQSSVREWASTNIVNLRHDPLGSLVVSAFIPSEQLITWPFLIALALFGANRVLGNWRTAIVCAVGHLLGTLVSEGIVAYRIGAGLLPESESRIIDVGPSYVVVAAIAVAILYGPWLVRILATVDLLLLIFGGGIFDGLTDWDVAAVGHTTSIVVAIVLGSVLVLRLRGGTRSTADAK
ncbi:MAG TPA: rhomboid-like protein [Pseudonocardiaceae bacterium]|jgi:preprotein translocase subunit Sec61beta|nr:rhomboid-like protein [Pseudonocardiaceae bacterium]